jgi:hypothetical protein
MAEDGSELQKWRRRGSTAPRPLPFSVAMSKHLTFLLTVESFTVAEIR